MSDKRREPETTAVDFFDGVAEMRAHLDRHRGQSGRELLTRMAFELTRPRSFMALMQWFCENLMLAVSARGAAVLIAGDVVAKAGVIEALPSDAARTAALTEVAEKRELVSLPRGSLVPLMGASSVFGALWIEHDHPLERNLSSLLQAVIDAVAMSLDSSRSRGTA